MTSWAQVGLQDATSPIIEEFIFFHDFAMVVLVFILRTVGVVLGGVYFAPIINRGLLEGQTIECIWTLVPAVVLVHLAVPSLILLYIVDERALRGIRVKAVGHQWYWRYEYSDFWGANRIVEFDSYMSKDSPRRLLDTDTRAVLPYGAHARISVGSADVLHSWTVPALGVKADACPGRLNQIKVLRHRPGIFFGQCREICGANHRFIPIGLEFVSSNDFVNWVNLSE